MPKTKAAVVTSPAATRGFSLEQAKLAKLLSLLRSVVERKTTIPVLSHLRLTATPEGRLTMAATDLDVALTIVEHLDEVQGLTDLCVNAQKLYEIAGKAAGEVKLQVKDEHKLNLAYGRARFDLPTLDVKNYPEIEQMPDEASLRLPAPVLREMLSRVVYAITKEESRHALTGGLIEVVKRELRIVATDGHRLSYTAHQLQDAAEPVKLLIPIKAIKALLLLCGDSEDEVQIARSGNHAFFRLNGYTLTTRVMEGQFPNYEQVLPRSYELRAKFDNDELIRELEAITLMSDARTSTVKLKLVADAIHLSAEHADTGAGATSLPVEYDGPEVAFAFNGHYLIEGLRAHESSVLKVKDSQSQIEFTSEEPGAVAHRYVVMPMRL